MHDLDSIDIAGDQFVHRYHIFRIVVLDLKEIGDLTVRALRQIAANLYIDPFIPPHGNKVDLLGGVFADIHIVAFPPKLKVHDIFQHGGDGFRIEAHDAIFERSIRQIELFLCFQDSFTLHIVPLTAVDHKSLFQPFHSQKRI